MISFISFLMPYLFEIKFEIIALTIDYKNCVMKCSGKDGKLPFLHQVRINAN